MEAIDFSCKHHVLIRNCDGSLQPMDMPYFDAVNIAPGVWRILTDGDYHYLVEGDDEAIAIDTGYGCGNTRAMLQTLTEKPVRRVVNTHEHFDHTANNCYFEKAYMSPRAVPNATVPSPSFAGIHFPRDYAIETVKAGDVIELSGRPLQVFEMDFHADGSILLLDRKARILFSGDELMPFGGMVKNGRTVEEYARQLQTLYDYRSEFDYLCGGTGSMMGADLIDKLLKSAEWVLAGNEGKVPAQNPGNPARAKADAPKDTVIYDRMSPRPEDMPNHKRDASMDRVVDCFGTRLTYDSRFIRA